MTQTNSNKKTSIGGQALIEGVMMRGPRLSAMAVRKPDGEIDQSTWQNPGGTKAWYKRIPFVRGVFNLVESLSVGYKCLMKSADLAGTEDEEPSGFEKKLMNLLGDKFLSVFSGLAMVLGLAIAVGLFLVLPTLIVGAIHTFTQSRILLAAIEAAVKIGLFVAYIFAVSRTPDIHRVFEYHGAEHKTIACYEAGEELTPQNAKKYPRFHPRCGTSFILIVLIISVLLFSMVSWDSLLLRIGLKFLMLPLVVGIAYEIIKLAGRYDNPVTRAISAPGLWLQRLTTFEPDDTQLEVAIAAMKPCIPQDKTEDRW